MRSIYIIYLLIIIIFLGYTSGYAQTSEIKVILKGNAGLHMTDGFLNIYVDFPYKSGAHNYMEYNKSELESIKENSIFIFTHKHSDHYSKKLVKIVLKTKNGKKYGSWNISELENLDEIIPDFKVQAFKTKHNFSLNHYSYLITWHNKKIFLSGDTESAETIGEMTNLDWAFIPAWLVLDSNEKNIKIDTKMIGIYHIGPRDNINITGEKVLMLKKQEEVISIPKTKNTVANKGYNSLFTPS